MSTAAAFLWSLVAYCTTRVEDYQRLMAAMAMNEAGAGLPFPPRLVRTTRLVFMTPRNAAAVPARCGRRVTDPRRIAQAAHYWLARNDPSADQFSPQGERTVCMQMEIM